jgi:hypothetical protein
MRDLTQIPSTWRVPKNVTIETTSRCNLRCLGCPSTREGAPHADMDFSFYCSIIDRIDFPTIVVPYANGEPTLHPQINDIMRYTCNRGLRTYLTSNMTLFDRDLWLYCLQAPSYYQTIISLDGLPSPTSRSIEGCRPGSNRTSILNHIVEYIDLKLSTNSHTDLGIKICHRGQDWEEIEAYIAYWLSYEGIDFVIVGEMLLFDDTPGLRIYPCQYSDDVFMMIRWDGKLILCMYNDRIANGGESPMGQLDRTTDLLEVYNNEAYTDFREKQRSGIFEGPCATCGFAFTGTGFTGELAFRDESLFPYKVFYHRDYYNHFYSKTKKIRKNTFYGYQHPAHDHLSSYSQSEIQYDGADFGK